MHHRRILSSRVPPLGRRAMRRVPDDLAGTAAPPLRGWVLHHLANSARFIGRAAALCETQNLEQLNAATKGNRHHVAHAYGTTGRIHALAINPNVP